MSVTAAGMSRDGGMPRHRLLIAILAISVALNLCVVAGVVWHRLHPPAPPLTLTERFHRLEDSLDLTTTQRAVFDRYISDMTARLDRMRQVLDPSVDAAWAEVAKPDVDHARILQMLDETSNQRREFMHEAVESTLSLLATLTPEQRTKFIAAEREYRNAMRRRRAEETR